MRITFVFASAVLAGSVGVVACSSESSSSPGSSGSTSSSSSSGASATVTTEQCTSRCASKLSACGAPSDAASQGCAQLCGQSLTEAQLTCLEGRSCEELETLDSVDELCPAGSTSSSSSSGSTSSSGGLPTTLTISGSFGSLKAIHVKGSGDSIASNVSPTAAPSFSPSTPSEMPDVTKAGSVTVKSPSKGNCNANIQFTLNPSQVAVSITGEDKLPATDCATFTDAVASQGIVAELADVPYPNSTTKAAVTIDLKP
jgi:hypothetical protein